MSAAPPPAASVSQHASFSERSMFGAAVAALTLGVAAGTTIFAYRRIARARVDAAPSFLGGRDDKECNGSADDEEPPTLAMEFEAFMASERLRAAARPLNRQTPAHRLRVPIVDDLPALGQSWFASYNAESRANGGSDLFPSLESAQGLVASYVSGSGKVGLVAVVPALALAENEERKQSDRDEILASAFNDESDVQRGIVGCGPWTVSTGSQGRGVGFECISALVRASISRGAISLRLLQGTTNHASAALYSKLGFQVREPLAFFAGRPAPEICSAILALHPGWTASLWGPSDVAALAALWKDATGFSREGALAIVAASAQRKAKRWQLRDAKGQVMSVERMQASRIGVTHVPARCFWSQSLCACLSAVCLQCLHDGLRFDGILVRRLHRRLPTFALRRCS